MLKPALVVAALATFGTATVHAQSAPPPSATPAPSMQDRAVGPAFSADTRKLIGRNVQNPQNETIGEIEAIYLDQDGKVDSVIIGVGGFLGLGERSVRVAWKDLTVADNGEKVTMAMTKDQLKALPEYKYRDASYRRQAFTDTGVYRDGAAPSATDRPAPAPAPVAAAPTPAPAAAAPAPGSVPAVPASIPHQPSKDFNADGNISTDIIRKASVRNAANETIGDIEAVYVDKDGKIQTVVISVGGFLGIGKKDVSVKWSELQMRRDGDKLILVSSWTKDAFKAMPDYTYDRNEALRK